MIGFLHFMYKLFITLTNLVYFCITYFIYKLKKYIFNLCKSNVFYSFTQLMKMTQYKEKNLIYIIIYNFDDINNLHDFL